MKLLMNFPDWTLLLAEYLLEFHRGVSIILVASALFGSACRVLLGSYGFTLQHLSGKWSIAGKS